MSAHRDVWLIVWLMSFMLCVSAGGLSRSFHSVAFTDKCVWFERVAREWNKPEIEPGTKKSVVSNFLRWFKQRPSKLCNHTVEYLRLYYNVALQMCDQSLEFMSRSLGNTAGEERRTDLAVWTLPTFINCQWPKV